MSNPQLNKVQLKQAQALLDKIRKKIKMLANNDPELIFAFRRKIKKMLMYDERGTPMTRRKLKNLMRKQQGGICSVCKKELPEKYAVLDRFEAIKGYTKKNVRLICSNCDRKIQEKRGYK